MAAAFLTRLRTAIAGPELDDSIRRELVELLYPRSFRIGTSILTSTANGLFLALVMGSLLPVGWTLVALLMCGLRTWDWWSYRKDPNARTALQWARRFTWGILPFGAAGHHGDGSNRREEGVHGVDVGGRRGHHDHPHRRRGGSPADGVDEQRFAVQQTKRLGSTGTETHSGARGRNDDGDVTASIELRGHVAVVVAGHTR